MQVRLSPIGKTYTSYFVRRSPYVSMISESYPEKTDLVEARSEIDHLEADKQEMLKLINKLVQERSPSNSVTKQTGVTHRKVQSTNFSFETKDE